MCGESRLVFFPCLHACLWIIHCCNFTVGGLIGEHYVEVESFTTGKDNNCQSRVGYRDDEGADCSCEQEQRRQAALVSHLSSV